MAQEMQIYLSPLLKLHKGFCFGLSDLARRRKAGNGNAFATGSGKRPGMAAREEVLALQAGSRAA